LSGITEDNEPIWKTDSFGDVTVAAGPHLYPAFSPSAGSHPELYNLPVINGQQYPPVPIVIVGHFNDAGSSLCLPDVRQTCLDRLVIDRIVSFDPGLVPTPGVSPTPLPVDTAPAAFQGDGFRFTYPADWQVISGYQHMGFHGPTVAAAVGIGQFDLGCTVTSTSVACGADPHWAVPDDGVVLVYRFGAWLGMCFPDPATPAPGQSRVSVGGRPAILSSSEGSMTWRFPGAPEFIEARWGPNNPVARGQVETAVATWAWTSPSGCSGRSGAAASDQASSAPN
jgi:hypothetical protein